MWECVCSYVCSYVYNTYIYTYRYLLEGYIYMHIFLYIIKIYRETCISLCIETKILSLTKLNLGSSEFSSPLGLDFWVSMFVSALFDYSKNFTKLVYLEFFILDIWSPSISDQTSHSPSFLIDVWWLCPVFSKNPVRSIMTKSSFTHDASS